MAEHRWVALLRGINLGSRNRVPMVGLRAAFEEAGYGSVRTYIQSGNVLFASLARDRDALAAKLERVVLETFGVQSTVVLRTFAELERVAASHPFGEDTSKTHVVFLERSLRATERRALEGLDVAPDRVEIAGADAFVLLPNGAQGARLSGALLERTAGVSGTMRTWRTVTKLAELARAARDG